MKCKCGHKNECHGELSGRCYALILIGVTPLTDKTGWDKCAGFWIYYNKGKMRVECKCMGFSASKD